MNIPRSRKSGETWGTHRTEREAGMRGRGRPRDSRRDAGATKEKPLAETRGCLKTESSYLDWSMVMPPPWPCAAFSAFAFFTRRVSSTQ